MLRSTLAFLLLCAPVLAGDAVPGGGRHWPVEGGEAAGYPYDVHYGGHPPGGYERRVGKPYYWSVPGGTVPLESFGATSEDAGGYVSGLGHSQRGEAGCGCNKGAIGAGHAGPAGGSPASHSPAGAAVATGPAGDPYAYHFGPGFYRNYEFGHYRFPYYSYRRPWYDVGHPVRVRDTNLPW